MKIRCIKMFGGENWNVLDVPKWLVFVYIMSYHCIITVVEISV